MFAWKVICFPVRVLRGTWRIPLGRGFLISLVVFTLLMVGAYFGERSYQQRSGERELARVIAHLDETDPDWRFVDLEARRQFVPDDQNSIPVINRANRHIDAKSLNTRRANTFAGDDVWTEVLPNEALTTEQLERVDGALLENAGALAIARELRRYPRGSQRHLNITKWSAHRFGLPNDVDQLSVLFRLGIESTLSVDQPSLALELVECQLNATASLDEEPTSSAISQQIRLLRGAIENVERVLAMSRPNDISLQRMQKAMQDRARVDRLRNAIRGHRAVIHEMLSNECDDIIQSHESSTERWRLKVTYHANHANYLWKSTEIIKALSQPEEKRLQSLPSSSYSSYRAAWFLSDHLDRIAERLTTRDLEVRANLRAAVIAIAVERYRSKFNRWPEDLSDLPGELLPEMPVNPFTGGPYSLVPVEGGVEITADVPQTRRQSYSDERPPMVRFRLFDPTNRRKEQTIDRFALDREELRRQGIDLPEPMLPFPREVEQE